MGVTDANGRPRANAIVALMALAEPESRLAVTMVSPAGDVAGASYYKASDAIASWAAQGNDVVLAYPLELGGIGAAVASWMGTATLTDSSRFSDTLSAAEFTALVACIDAYRETRLAAFMERRPWVSNRFTLNQLDRQLAACESGDPRWLGGLLTLYGALSFSLGADSLETGLLGLQRRGWIANADGDVELLAAVTPLCEEFGHPLPSVMTVIDSPANLAATVIVRGRDAFWVILEVEGGVMVDAVSGPDLEDILKRQLLAFAMLPPEPISDQCTGCGSPIAPDAAFCSKCGASTAPAPPTSTGRATATRPVTAPPRATPAPEPAMEPIATAPIPKLCGSCGASLTPGKRFCTKCGAKVGV